MTHVLYTANLASVVPPLVERHPGVRFTLIDGDEFRDEYRDADILWRSWVIPELFDQLMGECLDLKWLHVTSAGFDWAGGPNFDRRIAEGLLSSRSSTAYPTAIAEYVIAAIHLHARRFLHFADAQSRREWSSGLARDVAGSTLLVYGTGSIGRFTAERAEALGMTVIGVNRTGSAAEGFVRTEPFSSSSALLPEADWVVLAMPVTPENRGFLGAAEFAAMRDDAVLINVGRGALIVEESLVEAMTSGAIAGAVLDVFEQEPLPADSPLWTLPNTLLTPHTSYSSDGNPQRLAEDFSENLGRFLSGRPLLGVMSQPQLGY
ncbi:D-2-hydroxyacid dehydrogenase [Pseudolysinimonas sp.]|uniref:D-2-hydroxyacid dehydrogenase n=1 Tax=Pseudolysinimonas sp. TaxID=2680009 RepID=UPI003784510B